MSRLTQRSPADRDGGGAGSGAGRRALSAAERRIATYCERYEAIRRRKRSDRDVPAGWTLFEARGLGDDGRRPPAPVGAPRDDGPARVVRGPAPVAARDGPHRGGRLPGVEQGTGPGPGDECDVAARIATLRTVSFLAGAPPGAAESLLRLGRVVRRTAGWRFWVAGDAAGDVVVVLSGEVRLVNLHVDGRAFVHRVSGPGGSLGLVAALDGLPQPHDAEVRRTGTFLVVPRLQFLRFLDERPGVRAAVRVAIGRLFRDAVRENVDLAFRPAAARVARFLLDRACVRQGDGARVLLRATNQEIGDRVVIARESASRIVADLRERGVVTRTRGDLFVGDWPGLLAEARMDWQCGDAPADGRRIAEALSRTRRYLAQRTGPDRPDAVRALARTCADVAGDLAPCRARGCPVAFALVAPPGSPG